MSGWPASKTDCYFGRTGTTADASGRRRVWQHSISFGFHLAKPLLKQRRTSRPRTAATVGDGRLSKRIVDHEDGWRRSADINGQLENIPREVRLSVVDVPDAPRGRLQLATSETGAIKFDRRYTVDKTDAGESWLIVANDVLVPSRPLMTAGTKGRRKPSVHGAATSTSPPGRS